MTPALAFWLTALVVAGFALPISFRVFRRFPDAGAGLSLALGLLLAALVYFLLRTLQILPFGRGGFILAIAVMGLVSATVAGRDPQFVATARRSWRGALAAAMLFTVAFFGYASFRSYESGIGGTEQPMDFLYVNAMLESESFPPEDPWFAGERASYYYFGYLQAAMLTSASGVDSSEGYNLSLAAVFASSAAAVASLGAAFARWTLGRGRGGLPVLGAATAVVMLLFVASLAGVFEFAAAHEHYSDPVYSALGVDDLLPCEAGSTTDCYSGPVNPRTTAWYPTEYWFWWGPTRLVPATIIEFPIFSFVLGDLHPHVMAIPGVLLAIALTAALWRGHGSLSWCSHRQAPWAGILLAIVFGGLAFMNAWDVLTCSALLAAAVFARNLRSSSFARAVPDTASYLLPAGLVAAALYSPWLIDFSSQAGGIYAYTRAGTRPAHAFLQFGAPVAAAALLFLAMHRFVVRDTLSVAFYTGWVPLVPLLSWFALAVARGDWEVAVNQRGAGGLVTLVALALLTWSFSTATVILHNRRSAVAAPVAIATAALLLLYAVELFFLRDIFFGGFPRQNTVFKFTYQAWLLLALAGSAGVALFAREVQRSRTALAAGVPAVLLLLGGLAYGIGAIPNRAGGFENVASIDGLAALARNDPSEYALSRWIAQNTRAGDVVLEASGRVWRTGANGPEIESGGSDWSEGGRIASRTGRPSIVGWDAHEAQWRGGGAWTEIRRRQDAVDAAYMASTPEAALGILREFDVAYVVVGRLELTRYPAANLTDFASFMDIAFEGEGFRVFRLHQSRRIPTS